MLERATGRVARPHGQRRGHCGDAARIQEQHARQDSALGIDVVRRSVVQLFAGKRIASSFGGESRWQLNGTSATELLITEQLSGRTSCPELWDDKFNTAKDLGGSRQWDALKVASGVQSEPGGNQRCGILNPRFPISNYRRTLHCLSHPEKRVSKPAVARSTGQASGDQLTAFVEPAGQCGGFCRSPKRRAI